MCATGCQSHSTSSSSRLTPTENQPRWGCLQVDEDVRWDPPPVIIRPEERKVRLRSNMGYLSGQNPL